MAPVSVRSGNKRLERVARLACYLITGIKPVGSVWATMAKIVGDAYPENIRKAAFDPGKKLVLSCGNKAACKDAEKKVERFKERMHTLMLWRKQEWPYEYQYWKKHRGLE